MTAAEDELHALRQRAYGPNADIHLDSHALNRLRELEGVGRQPIPHYEVDPEPAPAAERQSDPVELEPVEREPQGRVWLRRFLLLARTGLTRLMRIRRSTALILLGLAVAVAAMIVALVLVQRVQTDPLQVGAEQVARLSLDPGYQVPSIFGSAATEGGVQGFQEFHGLRVVETSGGMFGRGGSDACLTVYSSATITDPDSTSFAGPLMGGCAAGTFPAMVQFRADLPDFPEELRSAFPGSTGLQFVYDSANHEVVVFATE